ncbi:protein containing Transposase, IS605 OrfB [Candidatus Magnetobacterium bavaricum]|uniref:Protein containing Transposase, IS605 OrfB n=1 Tax=Candidatus Magnetobacterium bavaricum TaxID=29290 RepID=A0A0F3GIB5_9BACT|nr:protein containing Transposase, IS605 OrfB [Candidatus Magnetobacterium bavaricum]
MENICEVVGVQLHKINPAYTSQRCVVCGNTHRSNRNGEMFECTSCGYTSDADQNASLNILNRFTAGEYGPCAQKLKFVGGCGYIQGVYICPYK